MSYDIYLTDPVSKKILKTDVKHDMKGGTYAIGGTNVLHLNVTYNYGNFYQDAFESDQGIRVIYGLTGADSMPLLQRAIENLGNDVDKDYWKATEGNAKRALLQLLALAKIRPDGVWRGD